MSCLVIFRCILRVSHSVLVAHQGVFMKTVWLLKLVLSSDQGCQWVLQVVICVLPRHGLAHLRLHRRLAQSNIFIKPILVINSGAKRLNEIW